VGEERKVYKVLVGKPERKRPLRRPRHRWEDEIRMDLGEIGLGSMVWVICHRIACCNDGTLLHSKGQYTTVHNPPVL
jgi:hypothetical protein